MSDLSALLKAVEVTTAVMRPRFRNSAMSWTLHDVQDPQSAMALTTTSASCASRSRMSPGAGRLTLALRVMTTELTAMPLVSSCSTMNRSR